MRKLFLMLALAAAVLVGAQNASAQCCGDGDDTNGLNCPAMDPASNPGSTEGCSDDGAGNCIGGDLVEDGAGPSGCLCVGGTCICDTSGGPCPSAEACSASAEAACAT